MVVASACRWGPKGVAADTGSLNKDVLSPILGALPSWSPIVARCNLNGWLQSSYRSLGTYFFSGVKRLFLADWVRSPTAALRQSNSKNLGLADWPLSGKHYGSFGSLVRILWIGSCRSWPLTAERLVAGTLPPDPGLRPKVSFGRVVRVGRPAGLRVQLSFRRQLSGRAVRPQLGDSTPTT